MPSPIGHALGGLIAGLLVSANRQRPSADGGPSSPSTPRTSSTRGIPSTSEILDTSGTLGTLAFVACLPDLDLLWGRHNMETHSLGAALLAGLVTLALARGRGVRLALGVTLAWGSHVLFDWLGSDDTMPLGVRALWPLSDQYYFANAFVFDAVSRRYWQSGFWAHNLWAVAKEILLLGPITLILCTLTRTVGTCRLRRSR